MLKKPPANAGHVGLIPGMERIPGEENGNPLQYSCLKNIIDRGAWQSMGWQRSDRTEHACREEDAL